MNVSTVRFGDINIDESRIIRMAEGMLGFEHLKKYVLLISDDKNPFWWFQSIEDGDVAFVVISSFAVKPDYTPVISDDNIKLLETAVPEDLILLSAITIRHDPFKVTANLKAPIVVNPARLLAKQVVLDESDYPVQYPVTDRKTIPKDKKNTSERKRIPSDFFTKLNSQERKDHLAAV
ncbi:MAG: flagellar assembly protein FliW [Deltaproteobacteria bacterium]|nr:flagellar assembly protein FliW [Deltaproteobacteria bacterium]